jgi:hypothetical protein
VSATEEPPAAEPATRKLELLILGGTGFIGPHIVTPPWPGATA